MPVLDVEIVASPEHGGAMRADSAQSLPADLTQSLADHAARILGTPRGRVWVKVRMIPPVHYAEDGGKPVGVYPVFVTLLKSKVPDGSGLTDEISRLTAAIAQVLNRPAANIHIFYQPDGAGRVAFGGKLVE